MLRDCSSCNTLSRYIMSKSETIAPLMTIISSPLMMPFQRTPYKYKYTPICIFNSHTHTYVHTYTVIQSHKKTQEQKERERKKANAKKST